MAHYRYTVTGLHSNSPGLLLQALAPHSQVLMHLQ